MTTPFRFIPVWSPRSARRGMDGAASAKPADMFLAFRRVLGMPHKEFGMPRPGFFLFRACRSLVRFLLARPLKSFAPAVKRLEHPLEIIVLYCKYFISLHFVWLLSHKLY